jgi:hypothetical protein
MPALLFAQQEVSIWDFRIPETKYQRLTGSLSGGWNNTEQNNTDLLQDRSSNTSKSSSVQSTLSYNFAHFNENNSLEITANVTGQANHQSSDGNQSYATSLPVTYNTLSTQVQTNYHVNILPSIRYSNYIVPDTWHWFAEGSGNYSFNQNNYNSSTNYSDGSYYHDSSYTKNNSWNASIGGGIGYGKLRDGSSVFVVLRILDKLSEDSVLVRSLTKDEVLQIVDIFARKSEYSFSQDRYVKYFMEEIFGQLQKMGVLKENTATAYSVLRAVEVLSERIEPRLFGWRARLGVQRTFSEDVSGVSGTYPQYYTSNYLWDFRDNVSLAFDYGYPLTLNLQVNSNFSLEIPRIDYQKKIGYTFQLAGIYQVGERIDATLSGSVSRTSFFYMMDAYQGINQNDFFRTLQYNAGISFRFFIENNVNFNVSCGYSELHEDMFSHSTIMGSNVFKSPKISFGVNYRFF